MKLVIAGYYGSHNLGDEALLESLLAGIRAHIPQADITVLTAEPTVTARTYNVKTLPRFSIGHISMAIRECDAIIFGGGGLIQDATSKRSLQYYINLIRLAKLFKKKIILLAQGIGPLQDKLSVKKNFKGVDLITVRDEASLKELVSIGAAPKKLALTADLALMLEGEASNKMGSGAKPVIGVSVRDGDGVMKIAYLCDHLIAERACRIIFIPFKREDGMVIQKIKDKMKQKSETVAKEYTPSQMLGFISGFDAVIGMRLHSLIFAAKAKVPCFGLSYDPKVAAFQKMNASPFVDLATVKEDELLAQVEAFLDSPEMNPVIMEKLAEKARSNFTMMFDVLEKNKIDVLGVEVDNIDMKEAVKKAQALIAQKGRSLVVTPNPEMIMYAQHDMELKHIVNTANLAPADGIGLIIAGMILGHPFMGRVAGVDLMMKIVGIAREKNYKIFLFGGREGVAEEAAKKMGSVVVGTMHGYSKSDSLVLERIKETRPDILFIGIGCPAQEKWAAKYHKELNIPLTMCVGGSFDVISNRVKRAPERVQKMGLEWLWRLIREPSRIKRMMVLPKFLFKVIAVKFGR